MTYENAPATEMLATHCAVCSRPLVDALSVELGIGPVCRSKHGFDLEAGEDARERANAIVHAIAADQAATPEQLAELRSLGFETLASIIADRRLPKARITLEQRAHSLAVRTPYVEAFIEDLKRSVLSRDREWAREEKCWLVAPEAKRALWEVLRRHFEGELAEGPKGPFTV